jgi:hypothetical protein
VGCGGGCRGVVGVSLCKRKNVFSKRNVSRHMNMTNK